MTTSVTGDVVAFALDILNAILYFIIYIFQSAVRSIYDYTIQNAFNPAFLFPGIGVGNVQYGFTGGLTNSPAAGFTVAWFYPTTHFANEGFVNGIYKVNELILTFIAVPAIFFMIVIQVFAVFFDILEGKLPVWREWFAKIIVAVVLAVLSYWIAGAVLLLGYLPFYALWTGFTFGPTYSIQSTSWMWSSGAVLLPVTSLAFVGSGVAGFIKVIFLSVELMVIFLLWFMIVLRNAIVAFLVAVLPIASILLATTWTSSIGKKLWRLFIELSFLPFFIALPLWIFTTLMWQYGAWSSGSLGAYMADVGFLIFALGMPYLFLEGIGQLQGMGFPSAGQAVALGTQAGIQLGGVAGAMAMSGARSTVGAASSGWQGSKTAMGVGGGKGSGGGSQGGFGPSTGGGGSISPDGYVQSPNMFGLARQQQVNSKQIRPKMPGVMGGVNVIASDAAMPVNFIGGLIGAGIGIGAHKLYARHKTNQFKKVLTAKEKGIASPGAKGTMTSGEVDAYLNTKSGASAKMYYGLREVKEHRNKLKQILDGTVNQKSFTHAVKEKLEFHLPAGSAGGVNIGNFLVATGDHDRSVADAEYAFSKNHAYNTDISNVAGATESDAFREGDANFWMGVDNATDGYNREKVMKIFKLKSGISAEDGEKIYDQFINTGKEFSTKAKNIVSAIPNKSHEAHSFALKHRH